MVGEFRLYIVYPHPTVDTVCSVKATGSGELTENGIELSVYVLQLTRMYQYNIASWLMSYINVLIIYITDS